MIATLKKHGLKASRAKRSLKATASRLYFRLLAERYSQGMLEPFRCHRCGAPSLDPCGRAGKRQWLCLRCADGEGVF